MNDHYKFEKVKSSLVNYIGELEKYEGKIHPKKIIARIESILKEAQ